MITAKVRIITTIIIVTILTLIIRTIIALSSFIHSFVLSELDTSFSFLVVLHCEAMAFVCFILFVQFMER